MFTIAILLAFVMLLVAGRLYGKYMYKAGYALGHEEGSCEGFDGGRSTGHEEGHACAAQNMEGALRYALNEDVEEKPPTYVH